MQIIINIPEEIYQKIKETSRVISGRSSERIDSILFNAVNASTPLPKGHGRLIDADELKKIYDERLTYLYKLNKKDNPSRESKIIATNWCDNTIDELPTIIEADKESEE